MPNCSQLPDQLAHALQVLESLPKDTVKYCQDELGHNAESDEDIRFLKACYSTQYRLKYYWQQQILELRRDIAFCNLLVGTWKIDASDGNYSGQLRIDSWETANNMLSGRIDVPARSSDFPITQGQNYIVATFHDDTLKFDIIIAGLNLVYDGTLGVGTGMITGQVEGVVDAQGQLPSWTARKQ